MLVHDGAIGLTAGIAAATTMVEWWGCAIVIAAACGVAFTLTLGRWLTVLALLVVVGFSFLPALKFFVSNSLGPTKDVVVGIAVVSVIAATWWRQLQARSLGSGAIIGDAWLVACVVLFVALYVLDLAGGHGPGWADATRLTAESFALFLVGFSAVRLTNSLVVVTQSGVVRGRRAGLLVALLIVGVLGSFDRTDLLLMLIVVALWVARHGHRTAAVGIVCAPLIAVGVYLGVQGQFGGLDSGSSQLLTLNGRAQTWASLASKPSSLLEGVGVGATGTGFARSQVSGVLQVGRGRSGVVSVSPTGAAQPLDSSYLATLADIGLPGLLVLLVFIARMLVLAYRGLRRGSPAGWTALGVIVVLFGDATTRSSLTAFPFGFVALYVLGSSLAAAGVNPAPVDGGLALVESHDVV
ncbi:MAG: hypothetical protein LC797_25455 [Chloroflexi bacterium]|nr:hypothetical protein [Chloroflexota bacterium]